MALTVNMPQLGESVTEGTIARWLKAVGERVNEGDILVEVETAKALQEVASPATGVLAQILVGNGATVPINTCIALIDDSR